MSPEKGPNDNNLPTRVPDPKFIHRGAFLNWLKKTPGFEKEVAPGTGVKERFWRHPFGGPNVNGNARSVLMQVLILAEQEAKKVRELSAQRSRRSLSPRRDRGSYRG